MWYIKIELTGQNTVFSIIHMPFKPTYWYVGSSKLFCKKKLARLLPTGAVHYYSWPICCIWWWPSKAISVYHISTATMQLSQFMPQVSQFNETNEDFFFNVSWHHMKQNWLIDWNLSFQLICIVFWALQPAATLLKIQPVSSYTISPEPINTF